MNSDRSAEVPRTCVSPEGHFVYGLHQPRFTTANLRMEDHRRPLGECAGGRPCTNEINFPVADVDEPGADPIFEIPNPFPFRGTTYIGKGWADRAAGDPDRITIPPPDPVSLADAFRSAFGTPDADSQRIGQLVTALPRPLKLALAVVSTDPNDLVHLAETCCTIVRDPESGDPSGLAFVTHPNGNAKPCISDEALFDAVANNPCLPDAYKEVMVLRPGVQGQSEIVGDRRSGASHVFEYLRRNSYIPWGHYAANMAHDAIRYAVGQLTSDDVGNMRHLYYQRTYVRLAEALHLTPVPRRNGLSVDALEALRAAIGAALVSSDAKKNLPFTATLWGWNYGFDFAPTGYRLHASHQQIHQQYALIPDTVPVSGAAGKASLPAFACGDMVQQFTREYRRCTGQPFFECYLRAIATNRRMDGRTDRPADLIVHQDDRVILFVPKAQTSQWELQLMTRAPVGNILEADTATRRDLDQALRVAMRALTAMGATMITVFEYSKRFTCQDTDQRLLYSFLPRLPQSPGAFSEAQMRWINGHYPEDFAAACRKRVSGSTVSAAGI